MDAAIIQNEPIPAYGRFLAAAGLAALAAGSGVVWYFDPTKTNLFPVCPLFSLTGFACPGCGLTRGFHALFRGDVITALDFNALIPFFAVAFLFLVATLISITVRGKGLVKMSASPFYLFGILAVLIVFGVIRNLPFYPFTFLFP